MVIIQIVPALPPSVNGLGDYALNLARQIRNDFAIDTCFIVADPNWQGSEYIYGFSTLRLSNRSRHALLDLLQRKLSGVSKVLLHYVGYGYAKRGCPFWLVGALQQWRRQNVSNQLVTMFHELYASSQSPLTSAFWLSNFQKRLVKTLLLQSNRVVTNREENSKVLKELGGHHDLIVDVLPVFSTVGEPDCLLPLAERNRRLTIFGHPNGRLPVYTQYFQQLEQVCNALDIEEIYDVGVPINLDIDHVNRIPIVKKGFISSIELSDILRDTIVSLASFPNPILLGRSTIFAAYCAHGLLTIYTLSCNRDYDGLQEGRHYLSLKPGSPINLSLDEAQKVADNAHFWYKNHDLKAQAEAYSHILGLV
jgi:hypothetical protein